MPGQDDLAIGLKSNCLAKVSFAFREIAFIEKVAKTFICPICGKTGNQGINMVTTYGLLGADGHNFSIRLNDKIGEPVLEIGVVIRPDDHDAICSKGSIQRTVAGIAGKSYA